MQLPQYQAIRRGGGRDNIRLTLHHNTSDTLVTGMTGGGGFGDTFALASTEVAPWDGGDVNRGRGTPLPASIELEDIFAQKSESDQMFHSIPYLV